MKKKIIGGMIVLGIVGLAGCSSPKKTDAVLSQAPAIFSSSGPISESDLGVPLYPNVVADQHQSFAFQSNSKNLSHVKTTSAALKSSDSVDKVESFYREKLSPNVRITEEQSPTGKLVDIFSDRNQRQIRIQIVPAANQPGSVIVILTQSRS